MFNAAIRGVSSQLVPAPKLRPIAAAEFAPAAMASQIVARPTPKQTQTIGPALLDSQQMAGRDY
jgi:hypothetical protein